jgi:asparagine N-glycosylation enzyme membrane subunit Stt3
MESAEKEIIEQRKKKIINFLKQKRDWVYYLILSFIIFVSAYIRSRNIPKLKDITTGTWTLGPDLDPFLFLRWAKEIVEKGSLPIIDTMRYVPLGYNTAGEMKLLSYMIAWFYHGLSLFSTNITVTYAAILFPVFMFALTIIAFFLFSRKIFDKEEKKTKNIIALIATAFFALIPSLLPRTIAGIPEKESAAFFFMFLSFYLFLEAFTNKESKEFKKRLMFGVLAGISTGLMALIWGGVIFIFFTIPVSVLLSFIIGKVRKEEFMIYLSWLVTSFIVMMPFSTRYNLKNLVMSTSTGLAIGTCAIIGISLLIMRFEFLEKTRKKLNMSEMIFSFIISCFVLIVIISITLGPDFIIRTIIEVKNSLIQPMTSRFGLTVAENRQPYFLNDWKNNFGPVLLNIPLYFWLFFAGSITLFGNLIKKLKKNEKLTLILSYSIFLFCLIFSRYSPSSILNGKSLLSLVVYFAGWLIFIGSLSYTYYKRYKEKRASVFREFNFSYILYFLVLTLGIIGARGGIRLIMVLGAISPIAVSFLIVRTYKKYFEEKDEMKFFIGIILAVILISSLIVLWTYYKADRTQAENFAPNMNNWQWQKAMSWVRGNTSNNAVFAHWWDYGYWVQSIGERATILDGGNAIVYWNHLLGRHVLTGSDEEKALEFLYTHNGTHLLIDPTDIGKYTAYSSIGADENYDRFSWIQTFTMNKKQTQETKNETIHIYVGSSSLDDDIILDDVFLPKKQAGVGAVILKKTKNKEILQPEAIFVYNGKQYNIPLRFAFFNDELHDFGSGLEAGIFLFPKIDIENGQVKINEIGSLMYLSNRTIHSHLVNFYLFNKKSESFKLVHTEENIIITSLKQQGLELGDFVYYQGFQGPIKIWEINYPKNTRFNQEFLKTQFPNEELNLATPGEYN